MTLHPTPITPVREETVRVARAAVPKGNVYLQMRDVLGAISTDEQFAEQFANRGRPVGAPWRLALVTVMQFAEGLADRQAAEAVRVRMDWKSALGRDVTDPGFDYRILAAFRARLVQGSAEHRLLDARLEAGTARGLLKARGRQRTDGTHVLGAWRVRSRLERVAETLRATRTALATAAPEWVQAHGPPDCYDRSARRLAADRLPTGQPARDVSARQVGADGVGWLAALADPGPPEVIRRLPAVAVLQQCWEQEYLVGADGAVHRRDPKAGPVATEHLASPDEREARFATQRQMPGVGDKVQLTQTGDAAVPHLLRQVSTTIAPATDVAQLSAIQEALAQRPLLPAEQRVDAGSVRARNVVESRTRDPVDLLGPVETDPQGPARITDGYVTQRLQIDWDRQQATCPRGRRRSRWCVTHTARQRPMLHIDFAAADCLPCPDHARCTHAQTGRRARCLTLQSREEYDALVAGRARQHTAECAALYGRRAGIEGTCSPGVRALGLRQAR
jgi:transposase